ncbi:MAG: hypothetical protein HQM08_19815 [Candidatus Riflebacteria bacterium]|nr:hypothetical protein [Candidatus Riflebacteria bacterium]
MSAETGEYAYGHHVQPTLFGWNYPGIMPETAWDHRYRCSQGIGSIKKGVVGIVKLAVQRQSGNGCAAFYCSGNMGRELIDSESAA